MKNQVSLKISETTKELITTAGGQFYNQNLATCTLYAYPETPHQTDPSDPGKALSKWRIECVNIFRKNSGEIIRINAEEVKAIHRLIEDAGRLPDEFLEYDPT